MELEHLAVVRSALFVRTSASHRLCHLDEEAAGLSGIQTVIFCHIFLQERRIAVVLRQTPFSVEISLTFVQFSGRFEAFAHFPNNSYAFISIMPINTSEIFTARK